MRRVPERYSDVDSRDMVARSTGIRICDDPRAVVAKQMVQEIDKQLFEFWSNRREVVQLEPNQAVSSPLREATARSISRGEYASATFATASFAQTSKSLAEPMVSQMLMLFMEVQNAWLRRKSNNQLAKWRIERRTVLKRFLKIIGGDKPFRELNRSDARAYRRYLEVRVIKGDIEIGTANKYLGRIAVMYRTINDYQQLDLPNIFERLKLPGATRNTRVAFEVGFARSAFFKVGAPATLNAEARGIFYVVAETGMRPSEVCGLTQTTIKLDHPIPHVQVRPHGREMKTDQSQRDIPLVGAALDVMKQFPDGFANYRDNASKLSAVVNKYLRTHGLLVEDGQSFYLLRHMFEDRLTEVEAPEKVIASLMGHKWHRPRYGNGPTLAQKHRWLLRIAIMENAAPDTIDL